MEGYSGDAIGVAEYQNYVEINHKLPSSVTVNGLGISMPAFLKILTDSVVQIHNQLNSLINPKIMALHHHPLTK